MKLLFAILFLVAAGCAPKSVEDYHAGENEEDIVRLLNHRDYAKAVWILESKNGKRPTDQSAAFLLAQAYLGKAGFEPLAFSAKVSGPQRFSGSEIAPLFPDCGEAEIKNGEKLSGLCLMKRIAAQAPDPNLYEFSRARELFRLAYPNAAEAPEWVNTLIGSVEAASCIKRAGRIYLFAQKFADGGEPSDTEVEWFLEETKKTLDEAGRTLDRAATSGPKISRLLSGSDEPWISSVKTGAAWADTAGLGPLLAYLEAAVLKPSDQQKAGPLLEQIRKILAAQGK